MARKPTTETAAAPTEASEVRAPTAASSFAELQADVIRIHDESITMADAERLAAKFLHAQMVVSEELKSKDLQARMAKNGRKTMESKVLLEEIAKHEKKPTDSVLTATVQTNVGVADAQNAEDRSATESEALKRLYEMLKDAHIFCRGIAKGNLGG